MLVAGMLCATGGSAWGQNPAVYIHYMPWFETPETNLAAPGQWGYHWTLNNRNPNVTDPDGLAQIASHYDPLIGPYASSDPDVIEYHLLLMRSAGVSGVLIDWYGVEGTNGDLPDLLRNSNALIDAVGAYGLEFAIVLEDRFSTGPAQVEANVAYAATNYFGRAEYMRTADTGEPYLLVFGPLTVETEAAWTDALASAGEDVALLTLWYEGNDVGSAGSGEYAWIFEDEAQDNHLDHQGWFYTGRAPGLARAVGAAYPGFDDFYVEGGVGQVVDFEIPLDGVATLDATLDLAAAHAGVIEFVQIATWNDFGEGTMVEPTHQFGYAHLERIAAFTGSVNRSAEFAVVKRLFDARKRGGVCAEGVNALLDGVRAAVLAEDFVNASALLDEVDAVWDGCGGDLDGDGAVDVEDLYRAYEVVGGVVCGGGAGWDFGCLRDAVRSAEAGDVGGGAP